jgi:hypothetical protein
MENFNLYQITSSFPALMENEEITDDIKEQIKQELHQLLVNKSKNIIGYIRNTDLTIEAMKNEEKRIAEIRKSLERKQENFKTYVKECMDQNNIPKVETEIGTISIAKSPISVEIIDVDEVPNTYKTIVTDIKIDKKKIADNFKATGEIPTGIKINTDNKSLRIK